MVAEEINTRAAAKDGEGDGDLALAAVYSKGHLNEDGIKCLNNEKRNSN